MALPKFNQKSKRENNKKVGERRENNHCRNCGGKNIIFFFPTISVMPLTKMWEKKKERIGEKNFPYLDYGNSIAENVKKKKEKKEKRITATGLSK